jgi:hypothetical protein
MVATSMTDMKDADMKDVVLRGVVLVDTVLIDVVRRFGEASKGEAGAKASAEGSMESLGAAAKKLIESPNHRAIGPSKFEGL